MSTLQKLASLSGAALLAVALGASAATPPKADEHAGHHPQAAASAPKPVAVDERMKAMRDMRDMRDKMASAKTPAERQALMADHMKAMQDGMQMMKGMSGMSDMGGMAGTGKGDMPNMGTKAGAKGMSSDMSKHHKMMAEHMDMMQTMMEMMMQRMSAAEAAGK